MKKKSPLVIVLLLLVMGACQREQLPLSMEIEARDEKTTAFHGVAMTMQYKVLVPTEIASVKRQAITDTIRKTFQEVHDIYNKWNPNSELSHLNNLKAHHIVAISPPLERLLQQTQEIVTLSEGRFDPTIEPLQTLWKSQLEKNNRPSEEEIAKISPAVGWHNIHFGGGTFYKDHDETQLDLGGIAKGLCIDLIVERLNEIGVGDLFVEWGGEIRTFGQHPLGRPWTVFISKLSDDDPNKAIETLFLNNQAIATSGDYFQNWCLRTADKEGKLRTVTYFHVFDPLRKAPLEATHTSVASVSVVAPSCALADGLATAAMLFPNVDEASLWAESLQKKNPNICFWIVSRSLER